MGQTWFCYDEEYCLVFQHADIVELKNIYKESFQ